MRRTLSDRGLARTTSAVAAVTKLEAHLVGRRVDVRCAVRITVSTWATGGRRAIVRSEARVIEFGQPAARVKSACISAAAVAGVEDRVVPLARRAAAVAAR